MNKTIKLAAAVLLQLTAISSFAEGNYLKYKDGTKSFSNVPEYATAQMVEITPFDDSVVWDMQVKASTEDEATGALVTDVAPGQNVILFADFVPAADANIDSSVLANTRFRVVHEIISRCFNCDNQPAFTLTQNLSFGDNPGLIAGAGYALPIPENFPAGPVIHRVTVQVLAVDEINNKDRHKIHVVSQ